jgi:hypothetical protein
MNHIKEISRNWYRIGENQALFDLPEVCLYFLSCRDIQFIVIAMIRTALGPTGLGSMLELFP